MRIAVLMEALLERQIAGKYLRTAAIFYGKPVTGLCHELAGLWDIGRRRPFSPISGWKQHQDFLPWLQQPAQTQQDFRYRDVHFKFKPLTPYYRLREKSECRELLF
jgi:hypothetical protein